MKILVIGAGLFGTSVATVLGDKGNSVDLIDEESDILQMASRINHNRIHLGYHYLRSIQTAEQSIEGLLSFLFHFGNAVRYQFPNYYAIAKEHSRTTASGFIEFCEKVGIGYEEEYPETGLLNRDAVEASFMVPEPVWDYDVLYEIVKKNISRPNIALLLNTACTNLKVLPDETFEARLNNQKRYYDAVVNCTYTNINTINAFIGIDKRSLLFEDVMIPVFRYNAPAFGITIMDGEFCSVMPRGVRDHEYLLYHVRESVINSKISKDRPEFPSRLFTDKEITGANGIYDKSSYFMPFLKEAEHCEYNRIIRTVYENSDDARLTQLTTFSDIKNYFSILSGKVTTCMQAAIEIKHILQGKKNPKKFRI